MTEPVASQILAELGRAGRGHVFTPADLFHLGTRPSVDKALSRLTQAGTIRRLARGVYEYPGANPLVGAVPAAPEAVARAVSRARGVTVQLSEAAAANALGLTTQVPGQIVYLTDGTPSTLRIGKTEIRFKRAGPRRLAGAGTLAGTVLQALRYLGRRRISPGVLARLKRRLPPVERRRLGELVPLAPAWMRPAVRQLAAHDTPPRPTHSLSPGKRPGRSSARRRPAASGELSVSNARPPQVVVIGGPNGAGKTSSAPRLLRDTVGIEAFVNADVIAEGLSGFAPQMSAIEAGRILLARLRELAGERADFAFESTLAGRTLYSFLSQLTMSGYQAHTLYLWLPSVDLAVARVRRRVASGGHDVPEKVIRRRFGKSLVNFYRLYRSAATVWRLYDGSVIGRQRLIAHGRRGEDPTVVDAQLWTAVQRQIEEASR